MTIIERQALGFYSFIQACIYPKLNIEEYRALSIENEVLEYDYWGVKVLETSNGEIIKVFRLKRIISSAFFFPYALRFKWNSLCLQKRGIETVAVNKIVYCREELRHVVYYNKVLGQPIKSILEKNKNNTILIRKLIAFVARLHEKGVYFRSLHFGNIILKPDGELSLIDISDMKFYPFKLTISQRIRNWNHLMRYKFERTVMGSHGWNYFCDEYAAFAKLSDRQAKKLRVTFGQHE